jgi:hypothetical protein
MKRFAFLFCVNNNMKKNILKDPTPAERDGAECIVYLEGRVGKTVTFEAALRGWRSLSSPDKIRTLIAYEAIKATLN